NALATVLSAREGKTFRKPIVIAPPAGGGQFGNCRPACQHERYGRRTITSLRRGGSSIRKSFIYNDLYGSGRLGEKSLFAEFCKGGVWLIRPPAGLMGASSDHSPEAGRRFANRRRLAGG